MKNTHYFLIAALISFMLSIGIWFNSQNTIDNGLQAIFVGIWVPSILSLANLFKNE